MAEYADDLALIVRYDGTKAKFETVKSNYLGKVVFIYGSETEVANQAGLVQAIWVSDANGGRYLDMANVEYISNNLTHISGITVDGTTYYPSSGGGAITLAGANGIAVTVNTTTGAVTFDASSLNTKVNEHTAQISTVTNVATQAKADSESALTKIGTLIGSTAGDDTKSAREIAEEEATKVKEEILGTSGDGDSISKLREDVDEVTEAVATLNGNDTVAGSVDKKIKDAIEAFAGTADADNVIENITELLNYVAGVDGSKDLADALAQIEENKGKIETLNGGDTTAGSVDKKVKDAIEAEVSRANAAYATKAQGEKADSAIQDVLSGNGTTSSNYINVTDVNNDTKKKGIDAKIKRMSEITGSGVEIDGLASALDIYAYMKARFSVKVVS